MIFVEDLLIDDDNEPKISAHQLSVIEVLEVLEVNLYELFRNPAARRGGAPYVIVGPMRSGTLLTIPIDPTPVDGLWRPRTAYRTGTQQTVAYQRRHRAK